MYTVCTLTARGVYIRARLPAGYAIHPQCAFSQGGAANKLFSCAGPTWGEKGFIRMARNVQNTANETKSGICGISQQASYPTVEKSAPLPVGPKTDPKTKPALPCNCTAGCTHSCSAFGMTCCGNGNDCDCSNLQACPKCGPPPPPPYAACNAGCNPTTPAKLECVSTQGVPGHICSPACPDGKTCPPVCPLKLATFCRQHSVHSSISRSTQMILLERTQTCL
jgi:hypothetical protein